MKYQPISLRVGITNLIDDKYFENFNTIADELTYKKAMYMLLLSPMIEAFSRFQAPAMHYDR